MAKLEPIDNKGLPSTESIEQNRERYKKYFEQKSGDDMSIDSFYTLLMAELSNQDPLEPMKNTEFISQMANFTSLRSQQQALHYSNANYATSLVGKKVIIENYSGGKKVQFTGDVTGITMEGEKFKAVIGDSQYELTAIKGIVSESSTATGTGTDGAFASSLIGKKVTVSYVNDKGETITDKGTVSSIEIKSGAISVIVNKLSYNLSDVVKVEDANTTEEPTDPDAEKPTDPDAEKPTDPGAEKPTDPGTKKAISPDTEKINANTTNNVATSNNGDTVVNEPNSGNQRARALPRTAETSMLNSEIIAPFDMTNGSDIPDLTDEELLALFR